MSDTDKIILTAVGGLLIVVVGQLIQKFIVEPLQEFAKLRGEISEVLIFYANANADMIDHYITKIEEAQELPEPEREIKRNRYKDIIFNHWRRRDDASVILRKYSSQLLARASAIPFYWLFSLIRCVPRKNNISPAASGLIGLSNSMHKEEYNQDKITEIGKQLKLKFLLAHYGK
jgi:hypothetical protein